MNYVIDNGKYMCILSNANKNIVQDVPVYTPLREYAIMMQFTLS